MPTTLAERPATTAKSTKPVDMKFEIAVIPVSDVDRAKAFYSNLGWRLDADFAGDDWRVIQFTPPGSPASVIFGRNVTSAAPGSSQGHYLIVSDVEAARNDLIARGVDVSEVFMPTASMPARTSPTSPDVDACKGRIPSAAATVPTPRSAIPTAMAGCSRR